MLLLQHFLRCVFVVGVCFCVLFYFCLFFLCFHCLFVLFVCLCLFVVFVFVFVFVLFCCWLVGWLVGWLVVVGCWLLLLLLCVVCVCVCVFVCLLCWFDRVRFVGSCVNMTECVCVSVCVCVCVWGGVGFCCRDCDVFVAGCVNARDSSEGLFFCRVLVCTCVVCCFFLSSVWPLLVIHGPQL